MNKREYEFVPAGNILTVSSLKRDLLVRVGMIAVLCSIADCLNGLVQGIYALWVFAVLSCTAGFAYLTNRYILHLRIDLCKRRFSVHYLKICGYTGISTIDLDQAKVTYRNHFSKRILMVADADWSWCFRERRSGSCFRKKNAFLREQLEQMHQVLTQNSNPV